VDCGIEELVVKQNEALRLRFTIRELTLATTIVALLAGWWVDRTTLSSKVRLLERECIQLAEQEFLRTGKQHFRGPD
jgi:hypothetical protein